MKQPVKQKYQFRLPAFKGVDKSVKYLLAFCLFFVGCSKSNEESLNPAGGGNPTGCDTANMKYAANIQPIIQANCYRCHGNGQSQGSISLDTYAKLQRVAVNGTLVGVISHASGFTPMPQNASKLSDCDINKIKRWVLNGALNN